MMIYFAMPFIEIQLTEGVEKKNLEQCLIKKGVYI